MKHIKLFENYTRNYIRVVPRDFFNEAKLLKCMGVLALAISDYKLPENIKIEINESGKPFEILLNEEFDLLVVSNYEVKINGEEYIVGTSYNSKSNFPFKVVDDEEILIFDENGKFTLDFIERFTSKD